MTEHHGRRAMAATIAVCAMAAAGVLAWQTTPDGAGTGGDRPAPAVADVVGGETGDGRTACATPVERVYDLVAVAPLGCGQAEAAALAFDTAVMTGGTFPGDDTTPVGAYRCRAATSGPAGSETFGVTCAAPQGSATFTWGV